ncbi:hypothetical protein M0802_014365 [Mischocyttarus mexicanus]|nr:hypothetical protein M0802_014365 [Mischocyttarus mexicanus]
MKECREVIELNERPQTITEAVWKKKEITAKNYIVNSLTNTQLELIISEGSAKEMIDKLDENFLQGEARIINTDGTIGRKVMRYSSIDLKNRSAENVAILTDVQPVYIIKLTKPNA